MSEEIRTIQQLFRKKTKWVQGDYAQDLKSGAVFDEEQVEECDTATSCFCLAGAAIKIYGDHYKTEQVEGKIAGVIAALYPDYHRKHTGWSNRYLIVGWNDEKGRTIQEIRHVVKVANV